VLAAHPHLQRDHPWRQEANGSSRGQSVEHAS
jgi:hypothetical protein